MDTWTVYSLYLSSVNCFHNLKSEKHVREVNNTDTHTYTLTHDQPYLHFSALPVGIKQTYNKFKKLDVKGTDDS